MNREATSNARAKPDGSLWMIKTFQEKIPVAQERVIAEYRGHYSLAVKGGDSHCSGNRQLKLLILALEV
jgi:hypothetical protein